MARASREQKVEAEKLFKQGMKLIDIAKKLDVPEGTVRSWKNRDKWEESTSKKNKCNVANNNIEKNATLQKRKKGGQPANKNAKGGGGNPHPVPKTPPDVTKHGAYSKVYWDVLDEEEQSLIEDIPENEEKLLLEQIRLFTIRERRIMKAINKYRDMKGEVAVADVSRNEEKRSFKNEEEEAEYDRRQKEKVDNRERLPGKTYSISTHTTNKDLVIVRLEQELSTVQSKKTKAIEALSKYRMEKAKINSAGTDNEAVDDWIAGVLEIKNDE